MIPIYILTFLIIYFLIVFIIPSIRVKCCTTSCPIALNTKGQNKRKTTTPGISTKKPEIYY